jgi:hypothetical protein
VYLDIPIIAYTFDFLLRRLVDYSFYFDEVFSSIYFKLLIHLFSVFFLIKYRLNVKYAIYSH